MDISEKRLPQDGKIDFEMDNVRYDLRVSSLPTINGEKFVIRILYKREHMLTLENLGFLHRDRELLKNSLDGGSGLILFSGPTGSGKTTTLYSLLNQMDKKDKNIITIEDPVEYVLPGISQVNVNAKAGLTFATGLRSVLRQDPDAILIGEIRDEETAQIAIRAAITGHLVLSTVHTNDAATTILRLIDMGIPRYLVADALSICVSQRLVRKICENCKTEYSPSPKEISTLGLEHSAKLYRGEGCILCNNSGYSGRTVVYEIISFDDRLRRLVVNCKNVEEIKRYNEEKGVVSLRNCCKKLTMDGTTTYQEYLRLCSSYM
jgi:type IV pilus assembly protein PilB